MSSSRTFPRGFDLHAVVDNARDAIGIDDVDGNLLYGNRSFRRMFGIPPEQHDLGRLEDYIAPSSHKRLREHHRDRVDGNDAPDVYEIDARRRNGEEFRVEISVVPFLDGDRIVGTHAVIRDVSGERARMDALLAENRALAEVIETIPLAVTVLDLDGIVLEWNEAAERMFGWTKQEVLGHPYPLAPGELQAEHRQIREEFQWRNRNLAGYETVRRRRDGSDVQVALWSAAIRTHGSVRGTLAVLVDISKQRQAQRDYRLLFEQAHDAIMLFEPDTERVLDVNPRACELYGLTREEFVGLSLVGITRDVKRGRTVLNRLMRRGAVTNFETVQRRADGTELVIECNATLIEYQGRDAVLSINRDLTERRRLQQQSTHDQRMKAVGQLAAGVAHEFNNVLAAILSTAESLHDAVRSPEAQERLQHMISRGEAGAQLTRELLTLSRKGEGTRTPVVLDDRLDAMKGWLSRLLGAAIDLELHTAAPARTVLIDPMQLEQIILNMTMNARDAMPDGGVLRVRTSVEHLERERVTTTRALDAGEYVVLSLHDTGHGIDPEARERLFEPFYTTKGHGQGTGLGLATVYSIVDDLGGAIDVRNDGGACFELILPLSRREATPAEPARRARIVGGDETILVVDDESTILGPLGFMLRAAGYHVLSASGPDEARRAFEQAQGTIDLLLTDVSMPGGSGIDLARELLARSDSLRVVIMSGYIDDTAVESLERAGFVEKPFTRASITRRIREVLDE